MLRIERQDSLQPLDEIDQQESEDAEAEQRRGVLRPALLGLLAHPGDFVRQDLQPPKNRVQKSAPALEYVGHVGAERLGTYEYQRKEDNDLQNSRARHDSLSEFLGTQQRVNQINKQHQRCDPGNDVIHSFLLQLVAGPGKRPAHQQKCATDRDVE